MALTHRTVALSVIITETRAKFYLPSLAVAYTADSRDEIWYATYEKALYCVHESLTA